MAVGVSRNSMTKHRGSRKHLGGGKARIAAMTSRASQHKKGRK
jgi:hypothetical protein